MSEQNLKNFKADKEGRYAEMAEHPPDRKASADFHRPAYHSRGIPCKEI